MRAERSATAFTGISDLPAHIGVLHASKEGRFPPPVAQLDGAAVLFMRGVSQATEKGAVTVTTPNGIASAAFDRLGGDPPARGGPDGEVRPATATSWEAL